MEVSAVVLDDAPEVDRLWMDTERRRSQDILSPDDILKSPRLASMQPPLKSDEVPPVRLARCYPRGESKNCLEVQHPQGSASARTSGELTAKYFWWKKTKYSILVVESGGGKWKRLVLVLLGEEVLT